MHPQQHYGGAAAGMDPSRSNVLLVFIDDVEYTPTLDALHTVFKTYGHVHKMTVFEKSGNWQVSYRVGGGATPCWVGRDTCTQVGRACWPAAVLGATAAAPAYASHLFLQEVHGFVCVPRCLRCRRWCSTLTRAQQSRPRSTWTDTACTQTTATRCGIDGTRAGCTVSQQGVRAVWRWLGALLVLICMDVWISSVCG